MKPGSIAAGRIIASLLIATAVLTLISWDGKPSKAGYPRQYFNDTTPKKKTDREKKVRDLDDVIDELDAADMKVEMERAMKEMQKALKELDGQKIKMDIEKAMKDVDFEKMQKELKESMGKLDIDMSKMQQELRESLKDVDGQKMKEEMEKILKEVDVAKLQKEIHASIDKVDWEKMKKEMDELKKVDMTKLNEEMGKVKDEMEKIGPQMEKDLERAKIEMGKAKEEMKEYKSFVEGLDNDGLIKKKEGYSIKHKDGELLINGKKASQQTYLKYKSFLEKHKTFKIERSDDDFNIDVD